MLERLLIVLMVFALALLLVILIRLNQKHRVKQSATEIVPTNRCQILYFFSTHCALCHSQQSILNEVLSNHSNTYFDLNKILVEDNMEVAKKWSVRTLPTTIILSGSGDVKQINNGLVSADVLSKQITN